MDNSKQEELRKNIEHIILTWSSEITGQPREKLHPETDQFIVRLIELIRNENLKLLAEIGEVTAHSDDTDDYEWYMKDKLGELELRYDKDIR